jgi:Rrf2 family protein
MVLRNQVEWAIHCCSILAGMPEDHHVATKDLAEFHGVPKEYLSKALQALAQADLVKATLGPTGGYRLARSPKDIFFLDIIEAIEGKRNTFACTEIRKNNPCQRKSAKDTGQCAVAKAMYRADEAWRKELASMSLEDLSKQVARNVPQEQLLKNREWFLSRH